jgi:hypothetical protein
MRPLSKPSSALAIWMLVAPALAQEKVKAPPDLQPKPSPALVDAFKEMTGAWVCQGKFQLMDGSGEMPSKSTMTVRVLLDGFAYAGEYQVEKNPVLPNGMRGETFWTYDAAYKKLVELYADSFGNVGRGTSDGLTGDAIVWDKEAVMAGRIARTRTSVKRLSPTAVTLTFDLQTDGKWATMGVDTCTKQ